MLNKPIIILTISIALISLITIPFLTEQFVGAKTLKKIHFTETITSSQDPGQGHESHQLALILSPNEGTIFDGTFTFTSSEPVQAAILHEIVPQQAKGQPTWTVDGKTIYGISLLEPESKADSIEFTGAALALHSTNSKQFTATVSVDGWIRGQPTEVILQKLEIEKDEPELLLSRANVPAIIPLHQGLYNNGTIYYIITDTNDETYSIDITNKQKWLVELAPVLSNTPKDILGTVYVFKDGIEGKGLHGYQPEIFSSTPKNQNEYSALQSIVHVWWKRGQNPQILNSSDAIIRAEKGGRIEFEETNVILNMPQIIWPDGQMQIRKDKTLNDETQYGGGQILDVNTKNMTVTFVAHRGWGPDGRTIYYIVTDGTPSGPAELMGVTYAPSSAKLIANAAVVDLFQFNNGIQGSGPMGFQPGIATAAPGDKNYSPICRLNIVSWDDPLQAKLLETKRDIDFLRTQDLISVSLARPMNSEHIINCPFIDPFQSLNSTKKG